MQTRNGIGLIHYGHYDEAEDGSYVANVWFALFYLPIVPLRAERVIPLSRFDNGAGQSITRFSILGRAPLRRSGALATFLLAWSVPLWFFSIVFVFDFLQRMLGPSNDAFIVLGWFGTPLLVVVIWHTWFRARPKLEPTPITPGSEFSVYRKRKDEQKN